ncbi:MAG TPA: mismatch-specific DNA-glycosylase [Candidatus Binataceae bacterium]|nr:mismatch-specific DNA-glycosylase [Candidatus Binataceae bacterium]
MARLHDILIDRPRILLVGINPSPRSASTGHHFAGPANPFWRLMHASGLVPVALTHDEDARLAEFGLAITNVCSRATRAASELGREELDRGERALGRKIHKLEPRVVAFVGVSIYRRYFGPSAAPGAGAKPETLHGARVFALPNPSGLNASFPGFKDKLVWFEELREFSDRLEANLSRVAAGPSGSASRSRTVCRSRD